jgi:hypothetical protein
VLPQRRAPVTVDDVVDPFALSVFNNDRLVLSDCPTTSPDRRWVAVAG